MLDRVKWPIENDIEAAPAAWDKLQPQFGARELFAVIKRQWKVIASFLALCLLLSICVLIVWPVRYRATAQVMIDPARVELTSQASTPDRQLDTLAIETQVEVGRSGNVLRQVVQTLNLVEDPEFGVTETGTDLLGPLSKLKAQLVSLIRPETDDPAAAGVVHDDIQTSIEKLQRALSVRRVGATNVFEIEVLSEGRAKSAEIANTVADEYLADQARARTDAINKASKWLEERLGALRVQAQNAEDALQDFKTKNRSGQSSATLLDLESQAQSYRRLYETFLDRHIVVDQQTSSPTLSARVITRATPPQRKSEPKSFLILGAGLGLGGMLGLLAGLARERLSRRLRSSDDVVSTLELPCLGIVPDAGNIELPALLGIGSHHGSGETGVSEPKMQRGLAHLTLAVLAETKPLDRRVLAVTSLTRGDGVTSIATALAYHLCRLGKKVSLIDANLAKPGQDGSVDHGTGAANAHPTSREFDRDQIGFVFTPAEAVCDAHELQKLINTGRNVFDYVIIDAPPLEDGLGVLPSLNASDGILLLLNSAAVRKSQVTSTLASWSYMSGKILGVVLNRAPRNS